MAHERTFLAHGLARIAGAAALLLFASSNEALRAAQGPFAGLAGSWSGAGTVSLANGARESIRCRATYSVAAAGNNLQQSLRCASDSYNFELRSNVVAQSGSVSGTWSEITRNVGGNISGRANGDQIQVLVDSPSFSANLTLVTQGSRQSISIRSPGHEFSGATITLARK